MKFGVALLAGVLVAALVFILYNDSRLLTVFATFLATTFSTLTLQVVAENAELKKKAEKDGR